MRDQYVISAVYKDGETTVEHVVYVTEDILEANNYDVSAYEEPWEVWYTHYVVDDAGVVIDHRGATLLYPDD